MFKDQDYSSCWGEESEGISWPEENQRVLILTAVLLVFYARPVHLFSRDCSGMALKFWLSSLRRVSDTMIRRLWYWLVVWGTFFYFPIYWVSNHPNWLSYFSEGWPNHQPGYLGSWFYDESLPQAVNRTVAQHLLSGKLFHLREVGSPLGVHPFHPSQKGNQHLTTGRSATSKSFTNKMGCAPLGNYITYITYKTKETPPSNREALR